MVTGYRKFLEGLGNNQKYDHLRLALQASSLLTPIVLLTGIPIHQSQNYCQRYRVMLVCGVFVAFHFERIHICLFSIPDPLEWHVQSQWSPSSL
jgi:hypothetical protein